MKSLTCNLAIALVALLPLTALQAQQSTPMAKSTSSAKQTDIYHVFIVKAALGKAKELGSWLKEPDAQHPGAKRMVLRHQEGDSWDFIEIEHIGAKATVETGGTPMTPNQRTLTDWHNDTFVAGPPWSEFAKEMGIEDDANKTAESVYIVSDYRAAPGHRDELEKMLKEPPPGDTSSGHVVLTHVEGAAWTFLEIAHYDSWEKFAESEKASGAQTKKDEGGWYDLRQHVDIHHDTLTDRLIP